MANKDEETQTHVLLPSPSHHYGKNNGNASKMSVEIAENLVNGGADLRSQIQAARDISNMIRRSSSSSSSSSPSAASLRFRFAAAGVIPPLICLLSSVNFDARESSLVALLNLAVRNERNKIKIVTCGAIPPLIELLKLQATCTRLSELATAAILSLSGAAPNKPVILSSEAAHHLVNILISGTIQGKVDAVTALYNLSTCSEPSRLILDASAASPLINLLQDSKKHSKFAEKTTALLEILSTTEEGRAAISESCSGILTLVETVECGSRVSMEHAVGALLTLCQSSRNKYRELILNEGAIPGLLRLTVEGTTNAQEKSRMLLCLLRESPKENKLDSSVIEEFVYAIASNVDGGKNAPETAQRLLQDMMHRNMEISMNQFQVWDSVYTSSGKSFSRITKSVS